MNIIIIFLLFIITLDHSSLISSSNSEYLASCEFPNENSQISSKFNENQGNMEIYWINLDRSIERRKNMEHHLNLLRYRHHRVKGLSMDDIYIPNDVLHGWHQNPVINTIQKPIEMKNQSVLLSGLYGRKKHNRVNEVGCTASHVLTIFTACQQWKTLNTSKYIMILEDDVFLPFDINYDELITQVPSDFGILQLFNSNEESMENSWTQFKTKGNLFVPRYAKAAAAFWSTCAYIINCEVLEPIIAQVVSFIDSSKSPSTLTAMQRLSNHLFQLNSTEINGYLDMKLIALPKPTLCEVSIPSECCPLILPPPFVAVMAYNRIRNEKSNHMKVSMTSIYEDMSNNTDYSSLYEKKVFCPFAPKGFQADSFIYALTTTYVLNVPLITNSIAADASTFHQDHVVSIHLKAFNRQRSYMNALINKEIKSPSFIRRMFCNASLPML